MYCAYSFTEGLKQLPNFHILCLMISSLYISKCIKCKLVLNIQRSHILHYIYIMYIIHCITKYLQDFIRWTKIYICCNSSYFNYFVSVYIYCFYMYYIFYIRVPLKFEYVNKLFQKITLNLAYKIHVVVVFIISNCNVQRDNGF